MSNVFETLASARLIIWDFDGIIKDSVEAKSDVFENLFLRYGSDIARRVVQHHKANGGVSRFEKIPLYLSWCEESLSSAEIETLYDQFSQQVVQRVIDSPWVPGVREYLLDNHLVQDFVLVTATPYPEIMKILERLNIDKCFNEVFGAPLIKTKVIEEVFLRSGYDHGQTLVIGDSRSDFDAAIANKIPFLLRRTSLNQSLQVSYSGPKCDDFRNESLVLY
jgi:phosphoglycolate phosphatase-like HAD superfamily hydrolase